MKPLLTGLLLLTIFFSCSPSVKVEQDESISEADMEAREDSLELIKAYNRQDQILLSVIPVAETMAVQADEQEDAADDPAIWIHPEDPSKSKIIGSNKQGGIAVYDLKGKENAYYSVGKINNIDVAYGVNIGDRKVDLVGGSNRSDQSIDLYMIQAEDGKLIDISAHELLVDSTLMDDIYGFCFYTSPKNNATYAIANAKNGRVQQFLITTEQDSLAGLQLVREIQISSQVEGMVADNHYQQLYIGEENKGIWKIDAEPDGDSTLTFIAQSNESNAAISYDIEGLTLYEDEQEGYLIASSQGNFSYAVFNRTGDNEYLFSFKISESNTIDGVEETDGIQAISKPLGKQFPKGLFIAQDGFNYDREAQKAQNFKIVDWRMIENIGRRKPEGDNRE